MNADRYQKAMDRAIRWILTQQNADGSFEPRDKPPLALYKVPRALALAGHHREAQRFLDVVERESLQSDGDFAGKTGAFHEAHWTYANCWLVWASHVLGRFELAYRGWEYLLSHRDPATGGTVSQVPYDAHDGDLHEDILSTAFTSFVGLFLGRRDEAVAAAGFLQRLFDLQPDMTSALYLRMTACGTLVTEAPAGDPEPRHYIIETGAPQQLYYFVGAAIVFLAKLHTITGDHGHLELAQGLLHFATRCHEDVYQTDAAGKIGLGAGYLYTITGDEQCRTIARRIADYLVDDQDREGYWMRGGKPTASSTAEFCVWLGELTQIL